MRVFVLTGCLVAAVVSVGESRSPRSQEQTAGQFYKNLKVLGDLPQSELVDAMFFMKGSLGVSCTHCHVSDVNFASDDKPAKAIARDMIRMVRALNQNQFANRDVVTCNTCHRAQARPSAPLAFAPVGIRSAGRGLAPAAPATSMPTVDQIFDRYAEATGGVAAQRRIATLSMTGAKTTSEGWTAPLEMIGKGDKAQSTFELQGVWRSSFDGQTGWSQDNFGVHPMQTEGLALFRLRSSFFRPATLQSLYQGLIVVGTESVEGQPAHLLEGTLIGAGVQKLYFDVASGRLVRVTAFARTPFGPLPEEFDVEDYRRVGAVTLPFRVKDLKPDFSMVDQVDAMRTNLAIDDARFSRPVAKGK